MRNELVEITSTLGVRDTFDLIDKADPAPSDGKEFISIAERIISNSASLSGSPEPISFDERQSITATLDISDIPEEVIVEDQEHITAYIHVSDSIGVVNERISFREFRFTENLGYTTAESVVKDLGIANSIESYFPDYFHQQPPYKDLIEALSIQASFNYGMAGLIKLVYDIDNTADNRRTYNALLRLLGIVHDFGDDYPSSMLKFLIQNYLSIRKHRGTRDSILAMLRVMDPEYLADPFHPNSLELEFVDYPVKQGVTIDRQGILQITYENYPLEYDEHIRYMLNKIIPTGIAYRLVSRKVKVKDQFELFDRAITDMTSLVFQVSEQLKWGENLFSQGLLRQYEYWELEDLRNASNQDINYFEERAYIEIHVQDECFMEEGSTSNQISVFDNFLGTDLQAEINSYEYVVKHISDNMAQVGDDNDSPEVASDWPYPQYNKIDSLSPDSLSFSDSTPFVARLIEVREELTLAEQFAAPLEATYPVSDELFLNDGRYRITIYEN